LGVLPYYAQWAYGAVRVIADTARGQKYLDAATRAERARGLKIALGGLRGAAWGIIRGKAGGRRYQGASAALLGRLAKRA